MEVSGTVMVDFGQFYVYGSRDAIGSEEPPTDPGDLETGVWTGRSYLAVYAPRQHGLADVTIERLPDAPPFDRDRWDNVVETSLRVPSGTVVVDSWDQTAGSAVRMDVEPGDYRVRVLGRGFDRAEEAEEGDSYLLQLWPAVFRRPESIKVWSGFSRIFGG